MPLSTVLGASKRSRSFSSIGATVRLRIVRGGSAIVSVEDGERELVTLLRSLKAYRNCCRMKLGIQLELGDLGGLGLSLDRPCGVFMDGGVAVVILEILKHSIDLNDSKLENFRIEVGDYSRFPMVQTI